MDLGSVHLAAPPLTGSLAGLPLELWLEILRFLDIPDLLVCSRVCRGLRALALDRQLHKQRLAAAAQYLSTAVSQRPSPKELLDRNIIRSRQHLAPIPWQGHALASRLARVFVKDALKRGLSRRPTRQELLARGVIRPGGVFASQARAIERQRVVDKLKGFFHGVHRPSLETAIQRGAVPAEQERPPVRTLARMFSAWRSDQSMSKSALRARRDPPTRAHVHRLTVWFEQLAKHEASPAPPHSCPRHSGAAYGVAALRQRFVSVS